jgi:hypothetical protein
LEKYFGRQRQRGKVNDNPTVSQFLKNEQSLRVCNSINLDVITGNTRGSHKHALSLSDDTPQSAPKRKKGKILSNTHVSSEPVNPLVNNPYKFFTAAG